MGLRTAGRDGRGSTALRPAISAFGDEAVQLAAATTGVWLRLLPRLIALTLLGWVAYNGAVFLGAEVAQTSAWLLIPVLSAGVVLRLATVVVALRSVATELGAPALLRQVAPTDAVDDDRDSSLSRLLGITLLPFLAVYAAFGYVDSFARDVVLLSTYRFGPGELLGQLNPLASASTAAITVALIVVLFVARRLLERWQERSGRLLPALLAALVEASGLFVVLLSAFRLVEGAQLWLGGRELAHWWQAALDGLTGWLHFDLPDLVVRLWSFLTGSIWPVLWDVLSQPLAWLTLAALVFGSRALTLGDVLHTGPAVGDGASRRAERLRLALARADGPRRVLLRLQQTFVGDVDDKYLPSWKSLRLVLHAGWPFLGAFVVLFSLVGFLGDWSVDAVKTAVGGQPVDLWIKILPFLNLLPDVLAMSLELALLGAAFVRILQLRAPSPQTNAPPARGSAARRGEAMVVAGLVLALVAAVALQPNTDAAIRTAALGERAGYTGGSVQVDAVQLGTKVLMLPSKETEDSPVMFIAVRATVSRTGATGVRVQPRLVNGTRAYDAQSWGSSALAPQPGFSETTDFVFEVLPSDVNEALHLDFETRQLLVYYPQVVSVPLRLTPAAAAGAAHQTVVVTAGTQKAVAAA